MSISIAFEKAFEAKRKLFHKQQGEADTITLKARNQTMGAVDNEITTLSESWYKERIKTAIGEFVENFYVAETKIDALQVDAVCLVTHGTKNYKVKLAAKPSGLQRYYVFEIQPV